MATIKATIPGVRVALSKAGLKYRTVNEHEIITASGFYVRSMNGAVYVQYSFSEQDATPASGQRDERERLMGLAFTAMQKAGYAVTTRDFEQGGKLFISMIVTRHKVA